VKWNLGLFYLLTGKATDACKIFELTAQLEPHRELNKKMLALAKEVESGRRPFPKTEAEISSAL
jgi:hypothetical protein